MSTVDKALYDRYQKEKEEDEYLEVFNKETPKVSVVMSTYNAGEMLVNYSLKSVLDQTYKNLEIIVIGDGCTDDTEERVAKIKDSRLFFKNIQHGEDAAKNWYSIGVPAINTGMDLCTGEYVAHLDDDDYFLPEKIETLVNFNKKAKAALVHHPFTIHYPESEKSTLVQIESLVCACGQMTTSSLFYHGWFSKVFMGVSGKEPTMPGDWNKCQKILDCGGDTARCPEILLIKNETRECKIDRNRVYRPRG